MCFSEQEVEYCSEEGILLDISGFADSFPSLNASQI